MTVHSISPVMVSLTEEAAISTTPVKPIFEVMELFPRTEISVGSGMEPPSFPLIFCPPGDFITYVNTDNSTVDPDTFRADIINGTTFVSHLDPVQYLPDWWIQLPAVEVDVTTYSKLSIRCAKNDTARTLLPGLTDFVIEYTIYPAETITISPNVVNQTLDT
jgi:hypothetical protein